MRPLACVVAVVVGFSLPVLAQVTERVSVSSEGEQANSYSQIGRISADGRYVVFCSDATNLTALDLMGYRGVFVRDRLLGTTELVSLSSAGEVGHGDCETPAISADGKFAVFVSWAPDLVPGDGDAWRDVFVRDLAAGTTEQVSIGVAGEQLNEDAGLWMSHPISADGRYVLFSSATGGFLRDRVLGTTECITVDASGDPVGGSADAISADGRFVVFSSFAAGIVPEDTDEMLDVFVRDRQSGAVELVSVDSSGQPLHKWTQWPAISADGRCVAFGARTYTPGYDPEPQQVYVRDLLAGTTEIVSVPDGDSPPDYAFDSVAPALTADGRYVVFGSNSPNLVPGDTNQRSDIFVRDRLAKLTTRINVSAAGEEADDNCDYSAISDDGRWVVFASEAADLVPDDTNEAYDVFACFRPGVPIFGDVLAEHWAFAAITACVEAGIVSGYPDGAYHPDEQASRAQVAVYVARSLAGGDDLVPAGPAEPTFSDVDADHWAFKYVEYAVDHGIVQGYWNGYHPDEPVSRAQMAVFIARAIVTPTDRPDLPSYTPPETPTFSDVPTDFWAYRYIEYIAQDSVNVSHGYPNGTYQPATVVTRDQMAVYVQRAFDLPM